MKAKVNLEKVSLFIYILLQNEIVCGIFLKCKRG